MVSVNGSRSTEWNQRTTHDSSLAAGREAIFTGMEGDDRAASTLFYFLSDYTVHKRIEEAAEAIGIPGLTEGIQND